MSIDWNLAASLLHVAEKTTQWPTLHGLRDKALHELEEINVEASKEMKEIRDKIAEAEAKAAAERVAAAEKAAAAAAESSPAQSGYGSRLQSRFSEKEAN